ncbi:hypothetical protein [Candidatus Phyllobacterium onerii]|uniref:hypothetical protein n=1 Tax=Candidatus Phyllobacterium onerii TaxID=3020828 RepID=UPI0023315A89|nr:hypothetical protein [Phyllobacterium sp. IY22]
MRSLVLRTALAALLVTTPFASAFARGGGMGGGHGGGMGGGFHSGQSLDSSMGSVNSSQSMGGSRLNPTGNTDQEPLGDFRQDFDGVPLQRPHIGTSHRVFSSGSRMHMNSVDQSTATPGHTAIRVR